MNEQATIYAAIARVLDEKGVAVPELSHSTKLGADGLGLDSLDMATVVADLDGLLGKDPFATGTASFLTLGELVALYQETATL